MIDWSQTWNWFDGQWVPGNPPLMGPRTHAAWMCSSVFDGARAMAGHMPDLERHCERLDESARRMGLQPVMKTSRIMDLCREGIGRFDARAEIYIKPLYWAEGNGPTLITPRAATTRFCLCLFEAPLAPEGHAISVALSPFRRPTADSMPVDAKAGCLYPNSARAICEANARGFDTAVMRDALGNVAELASANLFVARGQIVRTPVPNGSFLNGITRQRVIALLRADGITVEECTLTWDDVLNADEAFATSNYNKVVPIARAGERHFESNPLGARARALYLEFAFGQKI